MYFRVELHKLLLKDFRERITVETGLIVVGSADSHLRVSKRKKRLEGITQTMVDRNLMEEIRTFLVGILTNTGKTCQDCSDRTMLDNF